MTHSLPASTTKGMLGYFDSTQILLDLQRGNEIAQSLAGCFELEEIARRVTAGIVERFDCIFARLWLLEPGDTTLRLVASSGMYTNLNGRFARVPLGAYKVGKIAQNRVAFLSNNLVNEPWVGDREWAIANRIRGFAGYPLVANNHVVGVLATFSQQVMAPEFLEILQMLCTISAIALDTALHYQQEKQTQPLLGTSLPMGALPLSEQLVSILHATRLTLVGTEQPLSPAVAFTFLQTAEVLQQLGCTYCRLIYSSAQVGMEAVVPCHTTAKTTLDNAFQPLRAIAVGLGGTLETQLQDNQRALQVTLEVPEGVPIASHLPLRIQCTTPILQMALTQLARLAGLPLQFNQDASVPLLTDDPAQVPMADKVLWLQQSPQPPPKGVQAIIQLTTTPEQLQAAVTAVLNNERWGLPAPVPQLLSDRELEILQLLTQGHRDRDIADRLVISESTVKFHINNVLTKLKARTRYQAIHYAVVQGWL